MNKKFPHLFSPLKIGPLTVRNRIESAPTSVAELSPECSLTKDAIAYYRLKAKGGAGIVTIGESIVHSKTGKSHPKQILLDDERVLPSLVEAADAIKQHGAIASIELSHGGIECIPEFIGGRRAIGPSALKTKVGFRVEDENAEDVYSEEMDEAMMEEIAESFANGALTAKKAGFDMCMVHGAHGWLLSQFLSPLTNKRTDKYGGSLENRARFPIMVLDRIREKVGRDFPIEYRMNGSDLAGGGLTIEEAVQFAKMIEDKVDLIHVSAGAHSEMQTLTVMHPSSFLPHGCNVYLAAAIKKAVKVPVTTVGGISDPEQMERILAEGKADMIAMARALLADPFLPKKAASGREEEIVHCLRCFECQGGMFATRTMKCAVNPIIGREYESFFIQPARESRKVLIVGGGPAGLEAAVVAAERGHKVVLVEKTGSLGGALKFADHVSFKADLKRYKELMIRKANSLPIDIRLNTEATPELVREVQPDVLIAAVGAEPVIPNIPGIDKKHVVLATDVFNGNVKIGNKVVIVGGGQVGAETGLELTKAGHDVTVIEMQDQIAADANIMHRRALMLELEKGTKMETGLVVTEITDDGVVAEHKQGNRRVFPADTVIIAAGTRSRTELVDRLREIAPGEFAAIGDCVRPKKVLEAVRSGYNAALDIDF